MMHSENHNSPPEEEGGTLEDSGGRAEKVKEQEEEEGHPRKSVVVEPADSDRASSSPLAKNVPIEKLQRNVSPQSPSETAATGSAAVPPPPDMAVAGAAPASSFPSSVSSQPQGADNSNAGQADRKRTKSSRSEGQAGCGLPKKQRRPSPQSASETDGAGGCSSAAGQRLFSPPTAAAAAADAADAVATAVTSTAPPSSGVKVRPHSTASPDDAAARLLPQQQQQLQLPAQPIQQQQQQQLELSAFSQLPRWPTGATNPLNPFFQSFAPANPIESAFLSDLSATQALQLRAMAASSYPGTTSGVGVLPLDPFSAAGLANLPSHLQLGLLGGVPGIGTQQAQQPQLSPALLQALLAGHQQQDPRLSFAAAAAASSSILPHDPATALALGLPGMSSAALSLATGRRGQNPHLSLSAARGGQLGGIGAGSTTIAQQQHQIGTMNVAATDSVSPPSLPRVLARPEDVEKLSHHQVFLRHQIEAFKATDDDITTHTRGRNKPIMLGQVGIRCRHCAHLPVARRQKGSTYFPNSLAGLYQAAQNMSTTHLQCGLCTEMPTQVKQEFVRLLASKSGSSGAGRPYWAKSAEALGLVDTEDGIRFAIDVPAASAPSPPADDDAVTAGDSS